MDVFDAKALKLSEPMIKMISGAEIHEVWVNGEIVRRGYMIAGRSGTIVALMDRGICTASSAEFHGMNWLTELGLVALTSLTGTEVPSMDDMPVYLNTTSEDHPTQSDMITDTRDAWINRREAAIEADNARMGAEWDDVAAGEEHYESLNPETNELPYDAERIFDMENAALEGADIRAEYEAEVAEESRNAVVDYMNAELDVAMLIAEIMADDRLMYYTPKGVFVSGNYVETMRRISGERAAKMLEWQATRDEIVAGGFGHIDRLLDSGTITYGHADRMKRKIRVMARPHIGAKRKPSSSKRRNRR